MELIKSHGVLPQRLDDRYSSKVVFKLSMRLKASKRRSPNVFNDKLKRACPGNAA